jgi:hypothetical protein
MNTQLVNVKVALQNSPNEMYKAVEQALKEWGNPLRWAIMNVDVDAQEVSVEGLVTSGENPLAGIPSLLDHL